MDYCRRLKVPLEPFVQTNYNAYVHSTDAFDGKPQRMGKIKTDYRGHISELLAKAVDQGKLDEMVTTEDREILIESLRSFGVLDEQNSYEKSLKTSSYRGYEKQPGGGADAAPVASDLYDPSQVIQSQLWRSLAQHESLQHWAPMFQPVGGMDGIAKGFEREVGDLITYNAKVVSLQQDDNGVTVTWEDLANGGTKTSSADYCVCTIPFSILGQIDHNLSSGLSNVISSMYYNGSTKVGLEFKRRFWEQDDQIYGGISYTDQAISQISYPSTGYQSDGPAGSSGLLYVARSEYVQIQRHAARGTDRMGPCVRARRSTRNIAKNSKPAWPCHGIRCRGFWVARVSGKTATHRVMQRR